MKNLLCCLLLAGLVFSGWAQPMDPPPTVQEIIFTDILPVRYGEVAMGDWDGDRDMDLIMTGARGTPENPRPTTEFHRVLGDTTLIVDIGGGQLVEQEAVHAQRHPTALPNLWRSAAAWGDYDGNGRVDLALMGTLSNGTTFLAVYRNTGSRNSPFALTYRSSTPVHSGDLLWADIDHDGDLDLTACGVQQDGKPLTTIYENNNGGGFSPTTPSIPNVAYCSLDLNDFEIDGDMDFLVTGVLENGESITQIFQNDGRGRFSRYPQHFESLLFSSGAWGDYNGDGYGDFAVTGARISPLLLRGAVELYSYDTADVNFDRVTRQIVGGFEGEAVTGRYEGAVDFADLDNSGFADMILTGSESPTSSEASQIFLNEDGVRLVKSGPDRFDGGFRGNAVMVDYDQDRDADVVVMGDTPGSGYSDVRIRLLRNNSTFGRTSPLPPSNINTEVNGQTVVFSWLPGEDRQTPISGLTYNLRVGSSPGGTEILPSMSNPETGKRYVTGPGNVGTGRTWKLYGLPPGQYWWSVQALDQSEGASTFAEENTFTIE